MTESKFPFIAPLNKVAAPGHWRSGVGAHVPICFNTNMTIKYHSGVPFAPETIKEMIHCVEPVTARRGCPERIYSSVGVVRFPPGTPVVPHNHTRSEMLLTEVGKLLVEPHKVVADGDEDPLSLESPSAPVNRKDSEPKSKNSSPESRSVGKQEHKPAVQSKPKRDLVETSKHNNDNSQGQGVTEGVTEGLTEGVTEAAVTETAVTEPTPQSAAEHTKPPEGQRSVPRCTMKCVDLEPNSTAVLLHKQEAGEHLNHNYSKHKFLSVIDICCPCVCWRPNLSELLCCSRCDHVPVADCAPSADLDAFSSLHRARRNSRRR